MSDQLRNRASPFEVDHSHQRVPASLGRAFCKTTLKNSFPHKHPHSMILFKSALSNHLNLLALSNGNLESPELAHCVPHSFCLKYCWSPFSVCVVLAPAFCLTMPPTVSSSGDTVEPCCQKRFMIVNVRTRSQIQSRLPTSQEGWMDRRHRPRCSKTSKTTKTPILFFKEQYLGTDNTSTCKAENRAKWNWLCTFEAS